MKQKLLNKFCELYGNEGEVHSYFAPGRVNLIGEHTDYNGGHVFPCALTIGTYALVRKRNDNKLSFYSMNFKQLGILESDLNDLVFDRKNEWSNYPKGVIWTFIEKGLVINSGFDMLLYGNIPNGSGLSSSASVEVVTGFMLKDLFGFDKLSLIDIALYAQYAENNFNGMNCGIMDQFAIAMGKKDHAIFLDTADLSYQYAPIALADEKIIIACSNKKRGLQDSKYNERRAQCEEALADIRKHREIKTLGDLTEDEFEEVKAYINDPVCCKRARHAVYENRRTLRAVSALQNNDLSEFGKLMYDSHISLRDDYEVTGIELDTLAEAAWKTDGVIGSRMTGAGFGGCTVSIVSTDKVDDFIRNVGSIYKEKIGYAADFYTVDIGDGVRKI